MRSQHYTAVGDSLVLCRFTGERGRHAAERRLRADGQWCDRFWHDHGRPRACAERIINLERAFNVREGVRRKDDLLPYRVMHEPIPFGPSKGRYCPDELDRMLDEFYALRHWSRDGVPTREHLVALTLQDVVETMGSNGQK